MLTFPACLSFRFKWIWQFSGKKFYRTGILVSTVNFSKGTLALEMSLMPEIQEKLEKVSQSSPRAPSIFYLVELRC